MITLVFAKTIMAMASITIEITTLNIRLLRRGGNRRISHLVHWEFEGNLRRSNVSVEEVCMKIIL